MSNHNLKNSLRSDLIARLGKSMDQDRKQWAKYFWEHQINPIDFIDLLYGDKPVSTKFSWLLGDICEMNPKAFLPYIIPLFENRAKVNVPNFERSIARMMSLAGIPEAIEGDAVDNLFDWLIAPKGSIMTKAYSMITLFNFCKKYPELKGELKIALEDQLDKHSIHFKHTATKILAQL